MRYIVLFFILILLTGCGSLYWNRNPAPSPTQAGLATGAAAGAIVGGIYGAPIGAAIGGIWGAAGGAVIQDRYSDAEWLQYHGVQVNEVGDDVKIILPSDRFFMARSSKLNPSYLPILDAVVRYMRKYSAVNIKIAAYTNNTGSWQYDLALTQAQSSTLLRYFTIAGIDARLVYAVGYGHDNEIAANTTAAGRSKNRRVEISFVNQRYGAEE